MAARVVKIIDDAQDFQIWAVHSNQVYHVPSPPTSRSPPRLRLRSPLAPPPPPPPPPPPIVARRRTSSPQAIAPHRCLTCASTAVTAAARPTLTLGLRCRLTPLLRPALPRLVSAAVDTLPISCPLNHFPFLDFSRQSLVEVRDREMASRAGSGSGGSRSPSRPPRDTRGKVVVKPKKKKKKMETTLNAVAATEAVEQGCSGAQFWIVNQVLLHLHFAAQGVIGLSRVPWVLLPLSPLLLFPYQEAGPRGASASLGTRGHLARWYPEPRPIEHSRPLYYDLHARFHNAYRVARSQLFSHRVIVPDVRLHDFAYPDALPPRRPLSSGIKTPHVETLSERHPSELMPLAHTLLEAMRQDALTALQQWLLSYLVQQIPFDLVDFILCEIEDVISDGMKMGRFLPYGHIISYIMASAPGERIDMGVMAIPFGLEIWSSLEDKFRDYRPASLGDRPAIQQRWTPEQQAEHEAEQEHLRQAEHTAGLQVPDTKTPPVTEAPLPPSQQPDRVTVLMEQMVELQQQAAQREEHTMVLFQSMLEQQCRHAFDFGFIYQQHGIKAPPVLPAPHASGLSATACSTVVTAQADGFSWYTSDSCCFSAWHDIPSTFGTATSAFVSQFVMTEPMTAVMTETPSRTAAGSSQLEATYLEILDSASQPTPATELSSETEPQPAPVSQPPTESEREPAIQTELESQILEVLHSGADIPLPDPPVRDTSGSTPFLDAIEEEAEAAAAAAISHHTREHSSGL
nr:unnamed protein product [Digitaria exilis]